MFLRFAAKSMSSKALLGPGRASLSLRGEGKGAALDLLGAAEEGEEGEEREEREERRVRVGSARVRAHVCAVSVHVKMRKRQRKRGKEEKRKRERSLYSPELGLNGQTSRCKLFQPHLLRLRIFVTGPLAALPGGGGRGFPPVPFLAQRLQFQLLPRLLSLGRTTASSAKSIRNRLLPACKSRFALFFSRAGLVPTCPTDCSTLACDACSPQPLCAG